ncbi:MAG: hypothetical protein BYD32DRAFT_462690 [Podila humilis]|nr:MAG: hypothetical protein BYD32DRAFT_462690 [Podila humilis]
MSHEYNLQHGTKKHLLPPLTSHTTTLNKAIHPLELPHIFEVITDTLRFNGLVNYVLVNHTWYTTILTRSPQELPSHPRAFLLNSSNLQHPQCCSTGTKRAHLSSTMASDSINDESLPNITPSIQLRILADLYLGAHWLTLDEFVSIMSSTPSL